jgi:nucleotide-binding universal stress UspA family protein
MLSGFEKILVPIDGSESSLHALNRAVNIAKKFDSKITLINVYWISAFRLTPAQLVDYVVDIRKAGEEILEEGKSIVKAEGVSVESILKEGHIVGEIIKTAKEGNYDLIVMGARGVSKIREILLGSVSYGVVSHSTVPVMIVK